MADEALEMAPFPPLRWDGDFWTGEVVLPSWAGFQNRSGAYASVGDSEPSDGTASLSVASPDFDVETPPIPEQAEGFRYLMANEAAVALAVARALVAYYPEAKAACSPDESEELPEVSDPDGLRPLIGLSGIHILGVSHDGSAYVGFEFGCAWDDEHGAGVMTHRGRVISAGQADEAFTDWVAEGDPERSSGTA